MTSWGLTELPLPIYFETKKVLKRLSAAHAALADLKGLVFTIPNQNILINTLGFQEAKELGYQNIPIILMNGSLLNIKCMLF